MAPSHAQLPPGSRPTGLTLRVGDLDAMLGFYRDLLGLELLGTEDRRAKLAPGQRAFELQLIEDADAPTRPRPSVGLYHWALLLPERASLARIVRRLMDAGTRFQGFADHGVSEAAYLADPEGNGVELYRDRAPETWPRAGAEIAMITEPLDLDGLLAAASEPAPLDAGTRLGHIHLHVPGLDEAGRFYRALGLRVTQSSYPGALFLAAGDYHHHVGLNTWAGARRAPPDARGLVECAWTIPEEGFEAWREGLEPSLGGEDRGGAWVAQDPARIKMVFAPERHP